MKFPIIVSFNDATNRPFQFNTLEAFTKFIKAEEKFWSEKTEYISSTYGSTYATNTYLIAFTPLNAILEYVKAWKPQLSTWDAATFTTNITNLQNLHLASLNTKWICSGESFIPAWLNSYKVSHAAGEGFIQATLTKTIPNISSYDWLKGYLLAYEFELQDESFITKRRDCEKQTFEQLRDLLVEQKNNLVGEISDFKTKAENVTNTYVDFMRFEGPAEYWADRAKKCKVQGDYWANCLGVAISMALLIFILLMYSWLHAYSTKINLNTLEGAVIFASVLSFFAFAIKTLSKLTLSAYHLQRDAEEREQLTHLYLALSNDNKVDAESRNIVLQALFSRSDSGLLAGDHSPTMPSIQDAIKATGR